MTEQSILSVWESCRNSSNLYKAVVLASLTTKNHDLSTVSEWSIEKRDAALFELRQKFFGNQFTGVSNCPSCNEQVEWEFSMNDLSLSKSTALPNNIQLAVEISGTNFLFRLPNSNDLLTDNQTEIIKNCCLSNSDKNGEFSSEFIEVILRAFEKKCMASNISYNLQCTECSEEWQALFDIPFYLWKEIDHWAKQFLNQVYLLAKHLGWSENEIISMSAERRNYYLQLYYSE